MTMKTTSSWQHVRVSMAVAFCWSAAACSPAQPAPAERPAPPLVAESQLAAPGTTSEAPREATLILATIADNPQEEKDKDAEAVQFLPYLASHLHAFGITSAKLVYCHNPAEMAQWMKEGKVDLFDESPFSSYLENRLSGGADEVILNRWKNANEKFGGVLFTKADGPITKLDDLKGKLVAFRGDTSTTQYFLQRVLLAQQGYKMVEVAQPTEKVKPDEIGFYFAWSSRDKVTEDVMDGTAAAGGNSDEFLDKLLGHFGTEEGGKARHPRAGAPEIKKEQLRILARTPLAMRRIVTIRKALDPRLKAGVKDLLLAMDGTPEGQAVLNTFGPAKRYTAVDAATAYAGIADQGELIENEVKKFAKQ